MPASMIERGPQLVRDIGHEPAVLALRRLQPPDRGRERVGHAVELRGKPRELVGAACRHARREVARRDPCRRGAAAVDGPEDPAREDAGGGQCQRHCHEAGPEQAKPELLERGPDRDRRKHEVEDRAGALPAADNERGLAGDVEPCEAEVTAGGE
jgi:hypothetical protein